MEPIPPQEPEDPTPPPRDLRAELLQDLSIEFASALISDASIPATAREALVELLDSDAPTAAEIIVAVFKKDPIEEEVTNE